MCFRAKEHRWPSIRLQKRDPANADRSGLYPPLLPRGGNDTWTNCLRTSSREFDDIFARRRPLLLHGSRHKVHSPDGCVRLSVCPRHVGITERSVLESGDVGGVRVTMMHKRTTHRWRDLSCEPGTSRKRIAHPCVSVSQEDRSDSRRTSDRSIDDLGYRISYQMATIVRTTATRPRWVRELHV